MSPFMEALSGIQEACDSQFGQEMEFNGHKVTGIVTPIEVMQPFGTGGYSDVPKAEISISRGDWLEHRISDPDATNSVNRFKVDGKEMRVLDLTDDPICPWVRFQCGSVDN